MALQSGGLGEEFYHQTIDPILAEAFGGQGLASFLQRLLRGRRAPELEAFGGEPDAATPASSPGGTVPSAPAEADAGLGESVTQTSVLPRRVEQIQETLKPAGADLSASIEKVFKPEEVLKRGPGRSRARALAEIAIPVAQAFAGALAQPRYRRGRALAGGLLGAGAEVLQGELGRRGREVEGIRKEGATEIAAVKDLFPGGQRQRQVVKAQLPGGGEGWADVETGNFLRDATGKFFRVPADAPKTVQVREVDDGKGNKQFFYIDPESIQQGTPVAKPLPTVEGAGGEVAGPAAAAGGVPFVPGKPLVSLEGTAKEQAEKAKEAAKVLTLDQRYAKAVEEGNEAEQTKVLKAQRTQALAKHIREPKEPKGPSAAEERDQRAAEAFDVARALLDRTIPKLGGAGADPVEIFKTATQELYTRASKPGVSARTKAIVKAIEQELYRQLTLRFRDPADLRKMRMMMEKLDIKPGELATVE